MSFNQNNNPSWTWADLISSYRFWAIAFLFIISLYIQSSLSLLGPFFARDMTLSKIDISNISIVLFAGSAACFIPVWFASRAKTYAAIYFFIALLLVSLGLLFSKNYAVFMLGIFLAGLCLSSISLLCIAFIAKAIDSVEVFILSYGFLLLISKFHPILQTYITIQLNNLQNLSIYNTAMIIYIALLVLAAIFLLPANKYLFNVAPAKRQIPPTTPKNREPILVLILFFIPFYFIYWFVKVHQEIRSYSQSASLLSPFAAGVCAVFLPFGTLIMMATLSDNLIATGEDQGKYMGVKTWVVMLACLIFPPLAAAIVQTKLNNLREDDQPLSAQAAQLIAE